MQSTTTHWNTIVTQPEWRNSLHPHQRGRRLRYLVRQWRQVEARQQLLCDLWRRVWSLMRRPDSVQSLTDRPALDLMRWVCSGDILLDAGGDELAALAAMLARLPGSAVTIAYQSDIRRTARFGYHPVETVWLLEQAGYQVQLLTRHGPVARPAGWHTPQAQNPDDCWLLAVPPSDGDSGREQAHKGGCL